MRTEWSVQCQSMRRMPDVSSLSEKLHPKRGSVATDKKCDLAAQVYVLRSVLCSKAVRR